MEHSSASNLSWPRGPLCPRCGELVGEVGGWVEYGDQLVEITVMGCDHCGWNEDMSSEDDVDEWDLT